MDTWWIDKPHLLGSRNPTDDDLEQLRRDGFSVLLSLLCEEEQLPKYDLARAESSGLKRISIPVKDFCPPTVAQLGEFVDIVERLPAGAKVIVHCQGGSGRTGTFAAAHWIARGMTASEAIAHVRQVRPHAIETPPQEAVLEEFACERFSR